MPTNFPTSIDSYTALVNNVDTISAADVNNPRDAIVAIETLLGASSRRRTSWSPTITFSTSMTSATYNTSTTGLYARFGSIVYVMGFLGITNITGGNGDFLVNLPVPAATGDSSGFKITFATNWTSLFPVVGRMYTTNAFGVRSYTNTGGFTYLTNTNAGSPSAGTPLTLGFSGVYFHA